MRGDPKKGGRAKPEDGGAPPPSYPETYLEAAAAVSRAVAAKHTVGYFTREDLRQELYAMALHLFPKWDAGRPAGPFLRWRLERGVRNLHRDHVRRSDSPCPACKAGGPCPKGGGTPCAPHAEWAVRWARKSTLTGAAAGAPASLSGEGGEAPPPPDPAERELLALLDAGIPAALRADYLRLKAGGGLTAARKAAVLAAAREVLGVAADDHREDD